MIDPNWPKGSLEDDIEAYLNRMHIIVCTKGWLTYRFAGGPGQKVLRMKWPNPTKPDIMIPEATAVLKRYKKDNAFKPPGHEEDFRWSVALIRAVTNGEEIPRTLTIKGPRFGGDPAVGTCTYVRRSSEGEEVDDMRPAVPAGEQDPLPYGTLPDVAASKSRVTGKSTARRLLDQA